MGERVARAAGFAVRVFGKPAAAITRTTSEDTRRAARDLLAAGADLLLFAGGDGTARDILDAIGRELPVIGIPAGCKIHSAVYALSPRAAGSLAAQFIRGAVTGTRDAEVMDIDEDLFRQNVVDARLYGYLKVPQEKNLMQNMKSGRGLSEAGSLAMLSTYLVDLMRPDVLYIIGPGSTMARVTEAAGLDGTLLGVDLVLNRGLLAKDVSEQQILAALDSHPQAVIVVTVIGGQGYVFGRGNQPISARVIRRVGRGNIVVAASRDKMFSLFGRSLYADTGDPETDHLLGGYWKVVVGREDYHIFKMNGVG
jgi:predicted polyphosphate/ATP-dependent NAD kinase